jgi:O-antigen biosynthesis protein
MSDPPSVTVVVCTRDRPRALDACLAALERVRYPCFDVLVVDNAPVSAPAAPVAARWGVRLVEEPRRGVSRARNLGARESGSELVAYLDDDALPEPDWLAALAREFADPRVMAVAGQVRPISLATEAEQLFQRVHRLAARSERRFAVDQATPGWFALAAFGGIGIGANMAFRRSAFDVWAGFDERLGYGTPTGGSEEHDAFFQLIRRGHRVVYAPGAIVRHPHPSTMEELRRRHLRTIGASSALITRLLVEAPGYRGATLAFAVRWLAGTALAELEKPATQRDRLRLAPAWQVLGALASGPLRYAAARRAA